MSYYSISRTASGLGQYFYNYFFKYYGINYQYFSLSVEPENFQHQFNQLIRLGAKGINISSPYKNMVLEKLTTLDNTVLEHKSCNTIKLDGTVLKGFNTDLVGIKYVNNIILAYNKITVLGQGAMGTMLKKTSTHPNISFYARGLDNWSNRHIHTDVIVNCTTLGTSIMDSPIDYVPEGVKLVIDLSLKNNKLKDLCNRYDIVYENGRTFYMKQFIEQFNIHIGIRVTEEQFLRAERNIYNDR